MTPPDQQQQTPRRNRRGAPTILTPEVIDRVCDYLATGITVDTACAACGIATESYRLWLKEGRKELNRVAEKKGRRVAKHRELHVQFIQAVDETLALAEARFAAGIAESAQGYPVIKETEVWSEGRWEVGASGEKYYVAPVLLSKKTVREHVKDWRAGAWMLERRHADRWGQKATLEHGGTVTVTGIDIHMPPNSTDEPAEVTE